VRFLPPLTIEEATLEEARADLRAAVEAARPPTSSQRA